MIRSPIIVTVGHIDHGKTTLLDRIRGTAVAKAEAGEITQAVGASYVPLTVIERICGSLLEKFKIKLEIPGLLFIDTPGHMAFMSMRRRGGSISDIAILVIDVIEGFKEQTDESLNILKQFKVPFVIAATKIDKIPGWIPIPNAPFIESIAKQREDVRNEVEKRVYQLVAQLNERKFNSERFDRIEDFRKQVAIVPCSGYTGEGIPELLMILAGLAQQFLKERLKISEIAKGSILEVKEVHGLGVTVDVILYDGKVKRGDYMVIGGKEPIVTKVKALLRPQPLKELRVEKKFEPVDEVMAAAGIKISAPNLENVVAGSPVVFVKSKNKVEEAKKIVQKEIEEIEFKKDIDGVILKTDTLGALEALIKLVSNENIPIRKAEVGSVNRQDIVELQTVKDNLRRAVLAFNTKVVEEARTLAKDTGVAIFESDVIYRLIEDYKKWVVEKTEKEIQELLEKVSHPCQVKILKGFVFRHSKPAIFGIEVLKGLLKPGVELMKEGKIIGRVKEIQREGQRLKEAQKGERVAISMDEPIIGKTIFEGDILTSFLSNEDKKILKSLYDRLTESEKDLINELQI